MTFNCIYTIKTLHVVATIELNLTGLNILHGIKMFLTQTQARIETNITLLLKLEVTSMLHDELNCVFTS